MSKKLKKGGRRKTRRKKGGSGPCTMGSDLCCLKEGYLTEDGHLGPLGEEETYQNIVEHGYERFMNEYEDCSDKKEEKGSKVKPKKNPDDIKKKQGKARETCSGLSQGAGESCVLMGGRRKTRRKKRKKKKRKTKKRRKRKKRKTKKRYRNQRGCKR